MIHGELRLLFRLLLEDRENVHYLGISLMDRMK